MVRAFAILAVLATGCFDDTYHCTSDEQCDLGDTGRCERDGLCTHFDASCPTLRRYSDHAGEQTNVCFDDRVEPINACAGGQGPALPNGCFADVCARLPACCSVGWSDACVQIAQEACSTLKCDTRIAVNATRGTVADRFQLIWDGVAWTSAPRNGLGAPLAYIGPKSGDGAPRLAYTMPGALVVEGVELTIPLDHAYTAIASVGFDRDGGDTIAAGFSTSTGSGIEVWNIDTKTVRSVSGAVEHLSWGDTNRDGYPDVVNANTGSSYAFFENSDGVEHVRGLSNQATSNTTGGVTTGASGVRSIDWLDFDGDKDLDLAVFGASLRIHTRAMGLNDQAEFDFDCDPPNTARSCMSDPEPDLEQTAFVGAAFPTAVAPSLVAGIFPDRKLYRVQQLAGAAFATQMPFPNDTCTCAKTCNMNQCPGANCTCTYDCTSCPSILALVARDLDADHLLDLVAIDARLRVYIGFAKDNYVFGPSTPLVMPIPPPYTSVDVSVSGALIP